MIRKFAQNCDISHRLAGKGHFVFFHFLLSFYSIKIMYLRHHKWDLLIAFNHFCFWVCFNVSAWIISRLSILVVAYDLSHGICGCSKNYPNANETWRPLVEFLCCCCSTHSHSIDFILSHPNWHSGLCLPGGSKLFNAIDFSSISQLASSMSCTLYKYSVQ